MLFANNIDGERISSFLACKEDEYYCPVCGETLIFKNGDKKIPHFAHNSNTECEQGGESVAHELMKIGVHRLIERDNNVLFSAFEHRIGNRIADIYFEIEHKNQKRKVGVEVVHKHNDIIEFMDKTSHYYDHNVFVIWIFNHDSFNVNEYQRAKKIWLEARKLYYGNIFAYNLDSETMSAIHLDDVYREVDNCADCDFGEDNPWYCDRCEYDFKYTYKLKQTKYVIENPLKHFTLTSFKVKNTDDLKFKVKAHRVAMPFIAKWWK